MNSIDVAPDSKGSVTSDYITRYNRYTHHDAFVDLLIQQGAAHGHEITPDRADATSGMIGREFEVTLLCGQLDGRPDVVKGMTITKETDRAEGRFLFLEDIVVTEKARGQGLALHLMHQNLIEAWESGLNGWEKGLDGYAWETGRDNTSAQGLYKKVDPKFDTRIPTYVLQMSVEQMAALVNDNSIGRAELATPDHMGTIAQTLANAQPDYGRLFEILSRQKTNGITEDSFIVAQHNGGVVYASEGATTFNQAVRADLNLYLHPRYTGQAVRQLIRGVGLEIARRRRWQNYNSVHIEIGPDLVNLSPHMARIEKESSIPAIEALEEMGARALTHGDSPMVPYSLSGKRYVTAVIDAVEDPYINIISPQALSRLELSARANGLGEKFETAFAHLNERTSSASAPGRPVGPAASTNHRASENEMA